MIRKTISAFFLLLLLFSPSTSQDRKNYPVDVFMQLLDLPAPLPKSAYEYANPWEAETPPPIPDDDAPIELLYRYWTRPGGRIALIPVPSEKLKERFVAYITEKPENIPRMLLYELLPNSPEAHDQVKRWLDNQPTVSGKDANAANDNSPEAHAQVKRWLDTQPMASGKDADAAYDRRQARDWLMTHSQYFREELIEKASNYQNSPELLTTERYLLALAKLDWKSAAPILQRMIVSGDQRNAALGFSIQYIHAAESGDDRMEAAMRTELRKIVSDRQAPAFARSKAGWTLLARDWPGRDEWYLSLFEDASLFKLENEQHLGSFMGIAPSGDQEKWVPIFSRLIDHPNRNVHHAAVLGLLNTIRQKPSREALLPLLPWLGNPAWAFPDNRMARREDLIDVLQKIEIPESIPYLLKVLEGEERDLAVKAAQALAHYRASQAGPAIQKLGKEAGGMYINMFAHTFADCGALSEAEKLWYLELYATNRNEPDPTNPNTARFGGKAYDSFDHSVGYFLALEENPSPSLATAVLARIDVLETENPRVAEKLRAMILRWKGAAIDGYLLNQIAKGKADRSMMEEALRRRDRLRENFPAEVEQMLRKGSFTAGLAAVVLNDRSMQQSLLAGQDRNAQLALLACARLVREALPLEAVDTLYKLKDARLRLAADRYLEADDSTEARRYLRAAHPGEVLLLGAPFEPKTATPFTPWEKKLLEAMQSKDGPDEIFAMAREGAGDLFENIVIRVRNQEALLIRQRDPSRQQIRVLSMEERREMRELLAAVRFEDLPPLRYIRPMLSHSRPTTTHFLHLNKTAGRRVHTDYVSENPFGQNAHQRVFEFFTGLIDKGGFKLRYMIEDRVPGVEVLYGEDKPPVENVCLQNGAVLVQVKEEFRGTAEEKNQRFLKSLDLYDQRWRILKNGKLTEETKEPAACPVLGDEAWLRQIVHGPNDIFGPPWKLKLAGALIRAGYKRTEDGNDTTQGIWRFSPDRKGELIHEGQFARPLVTSDGKWIFATRYTPTKEWYRQDLLRIDAKTAQATSIMTTDKKENLRVVAEIDALGKILLRRGNWSDPEAQGYFLFTPSTNKLEPIQGEFRPLLQQTYRPLQATLSDPVMAWAALPDEKAKKTTFGRYDTKRFLFTPLLELPEIQFNSMQMWVDESANQIFVAYGGHLLRLPLKR